MCETPAPVQGGPKVMRQSWRLKTIFSKWMDWSMRLVCTFNQVQVLKSVCILYFCHTLLDSATLIWILLCTHTLCHLCHISITVWITLCAVHVYMLYHTHQFCAYNFMWSWYASLILSLLIFMRPCVSDLILILWIIVSGQNWVMAEQTIVSTILWSYREPCFWFLGLRSLLQRSLAIMRVASWMD
jgi:hypothetical protein